MRTWIFLLGVVFLGQLALIAFLSLDRVDHRAFEAQKKLLQFATDSVDQIAIDDGDTQVELVKVSGKWQLSELDGFPADAARVEQLLNRLAELNRGWPVATTAASTARFKVGNEGYERKISLRRGNQEHRALLIGTSPGFRKVHMRRAGEDEVYSVAFNAYEAEARQDDWIDRTVLAVDEAQVTGISWPTFGLLREGEAFQLQGLGEGETTDAEQVRSLVRRLTELRIQSVSIRDEAETVPQESMFEIELTKTGDVAIRYKFVKPNPEAKYYLVERSDFPYRFKVAEFDAKPLVEATLASLVRSDAEEPVEPDAEASDVTNSPANEGGGT